MLTKRSHLLFCFRLGEDLVGIWCSWLFPKRWFLPRVRQRTLPFTLWALALSLLLPFFLFLVFIHSHLSLQAWQELCGDYRGSIAGHVVQNQLRILIKVFRKDWAIPKALLTFKNHDLLPCLLISVLMILSYKSDQSMSTQYQQKGCSTSVLEGWYPAQSWFS